MSDTKLSCPALIPNFFKHEETLILILRKKNPKNELKKDMLKLPFNNFSRLLIIKNGRKYKMFTITSILQLE